MSIILILMLGGSLPFVFSNEWLEVEANDPFPSQSFSGDTVDEDGSALYVCRFGYKGCGHVSESLPVCRVAYDNEDHINNTFDVLIAPPAGTNYELRWSDETFGGGNVPPDAVQATAGMFVGRYSEGNHYLLGKVDKEKNGFYATNNHGRHYYKKWGYQVLVNAWLPIESYEILNVKYNFSQAILTVSSEYVTLSQTNTSNDSPYDTTSTLSMDFEKTATSQWSINDTLEMHVGIKVTVRAWIPFLASAKGEVEAGVLNTFTYTYGKSTTTTTKAKHDVNVNLPGHSDVCVTMIAKIAKANISYTATVKVHYENGQTAVLEGVKGIFLNVYHVNFDTTIDASPSASKNSASKCPCCATVIIVLVIILILLLVAGFFLRRYVRDLKRKIQLPEGRTAFGHSYSPPKVGRESDDPYTD